MTKQRSRDITIFHMRTTILLDDELARRVSPALLSFMSESRRLANRRLKRELRVRLGYPTVADALAWRAEKHGGES